MRETVRAAVWQGRFPVQPGAQAGTVGPRKGIPRPRRGLHPDVGDTRGAIRSIIKLPTTKKFGRFSMLPLPPFVLDIVPRPPELCTTKKRRSAASAFVSLCQVPGDGDAQGVIRHLLGGEQGDGPYFCTAPAALLLFQRYHTTSSVPVRTSMLLSTPVNSLLTPRVTSEVSAAPSSGYLSPRRVTPSARSPWQNTDT